MKKIILEETEAPVETSTETLNITTLLSALIKGEWDAIDQYNGAVMAMESIGSTEAIDTLKEIISEEYIHVGQLEKLAQSINPEAENITAGHEHDELDHEEV